MSEQPTLRGDTIDRARIVWDRPWWAVITQQVVHARFPHRREARRYRDLLNNKEAGQP